MASLCVVCDCERQCVCAMKVKYLNLYESYSTVHKYAKFSLVEETHLLIDYRKKEDQKSQMISSYYCFY